jgi:hypothetical protein
MTLMKKILAIALAMAALPGPVSAQPAECRVLQDPKTRVIYYLESDRRHVAALSPSGKLLWCCEVIPAGGGESFGGFGLDDRDDRVIDVTVVAVGVVNGVIYKRSGVFTPLTGD